MKQRRGFTLVEIAIVIAVIAILTIVLVPFSSNLIDNSKIKNDKILVDNMNVILSEDKIHGLPKDVNEVLWILSTSEFDIDEPNYKYHTFYWYREDNIVVIYDREKETIIYPKDFTYLEIDNCKPLIGEYEKSSDEGYKITYIINGKQVRFKNATTYSGENDFTLPIPSLENYTFSGWKNNQKLEGDSITIIPKGSTNNKTFYASFTKNTEDIVNMEYSITYILDGGTYDGPTKYKAGEEVVSGTPVKVGCEFLGWYTTEDFKESSKLTSNTVTMDGDVTVYAKWKKLDVTVYTISWNLDGGNWQNDEGITEFIAGSSVNMPIPERSGYKFLGWYEGEAKVESIVNRDYELIAKWQKEEERDPNVFYIYYELYGGAQTNAPKEFNKAENQYVYLFTPLKRGYDFEGWYLSSEFSGDSITVIRTENYNDDITLYAKWVPIEYEIVYELNNGIWSNGTLEIKTTYTIEEEIVLPTPVRNGYLFGAWYKEADFSGQPVSKISVGSTGTQTLYVNWGLKPYTIEYDLDGGSLETGTEVVSTYDVETTYELPKPIKKGYTFIGWYEGKTTLGDPITKIMPGTTGDKKLYAMWVEEGKYQIDYIGDGGSSENEITTSWSKTVDVSAKSLNLDTPEKSGYTFLGWYNNPEFTGEPLESIEISKTGYIKLYAKWEENHATV